MKDESAGLLAAAFIGIAPGYISRSVAGSYDNEAIAIFLLMFTFYSWIKALKTGSAFFGTLTALFYFYMVAAWGSYFSLFRSAARVECSRLWTPGTPRTRPQAGLESRVSPRNCALPVLFFENDISPVHPHMFSCRRLCIYYQHDSPPRLDLDPHGPFQQPSVCGVLVLVRDRYLGQHAGAVRRLPASAHERTYGCPR